MGYLVGLAEGDGKGLREAILLERVDEVLMLVVRSYEGRRGEFSDGITRIIRKVGDMKVVLGRMMPRREYEGLLENLSYWRVDRTGRKEAGSS